MDRTDIESLITLANAGKLKPGQRAMIAARAPVAEYGITEVAEMFGVGRQAVARARLIMSRCDADTIAAVEIGTQSINRVFYSVWTPPEKKKLGGNITRIARMRRNAVIWKNLRTALIALCDLPLPDDVAKLSKHIDRHHLIDQKLPQALSWLEEFSKCQSSKN